jgi:hypothetical protein
MWLAVLNMLWRIVENVSLYKEGGFIYSNGFCATYSYLCLPSFVSFYRERNDAFKT